MGFNQHFSPQFIARRFKGGDNRVYKMSEAKEREKDFQSLKGSHIFQKIISRVKKCFSSIYPFSFSFMVEAKK